MKDEKTRIRLILAGVAMILIVVIGGISVVSQMLRKNTDSSSRLQTEIIQYADNTQSKDKDNTKELEQAKEEPKEESQEETKQETQQQEQATVIEAPAQEPEETQLPAGGDSTAAGQTKSDGKTTAVWQVQSSENLDKTALDLPRQMSEMKGYWEAGNMEAVQDLAYLPRYRAASLKLSGTTKYYYFGDTDSSNKPNGQGLAMYADNQYYYGGWKDGVRSGSGMWIQYFVYNEKAKAADSLYQAHSYTGSWSGDLPNGEGSEHYDFIDENMETNIGYNRNFIGTFKNGLYDGEIYITNYYSDGNVKEWNGTAKNGVWQSLGSKDKQGQFPIIVEITNKDNYQWMKQKDNKEQGVTAIISAAKSN